MGKKPDLSTIETNITELETKLSNLRTRLNQMREEEKRIQQEISNAESSLTHYRYVLADLRGEPVEPIAKVAAQTNHLKPDLTGKRVTVLDDTENILTAHGK